MTYGGTCLALPVELLPLDVSENFLYPPQTLFVGGILFSRCPSVRASVCASVRP